MADSKNHNDSLERLFRKKAEDYDISYREEDWNKLEPALDLRDAQLSYKRRVRLIAAASFLIISLLGYFTYENHNRLNQISEHLTDEPAADPKPPEIGEFPSTDSHSEESTDIIEDPIADTQTDRIESDDVAPVDPYQLEAASLAHIDEITETHDVERFDIVNRDLDAFIDLNIDRESTFFASAIERFAHQSEGIYSPVSKSQTATPSQDFESRKVDRSSSRFSFGLVTAPDLSTVNSVSNFSNPGYKFGLTVEYSLSSNFSVSTGILQTMVRYSAQSNQYNPSVYWPGGITPNEMIGECLLFDIPITLKYNFLTFNRSRFFATAGVSSYIMQNEEYYFSYNEEIPGQIESWSGQTGTSHWMSNAGFSIGYEFDIHSNWSLRVEPFMKVPLKEVGWGGVKLYSVGSFVSLNFRL
ncbi:MAG: hypothetical protein EA390_05585 [Balneolaceae bacterium]|nr:MAG: hypothetical protein EA390_05585 [Balneolaceae bacterium]